MENTAVISENKELTNRGEQQELTQKGEKFLELCQGLMVKDHASLEAADQLMTRGAMEIKTIKAFIEPHIDRANKAHKALTKDRAKMITPIESGKSALKPKMSAFLQEEESKRKKEEARLQEEARKKEAEAQKVEEDRRLSEAQSLEDQGRKEEAEAVISAPAPQAKQNIAPVVSKATPKLNTVFIDKWEADVLDESLVPREYLVINRGALNRRAQDTKGKVPIPGCKLVNRGTSRTRTN